MKAIFSLTLSLIVFSASGQIVTQYTPNFLIGTWNASVRGSYIPNYCCIPNGTITFTESDLANSTNMQASQYLSPTSPMTDACLLYGLTNNSTINIPLPGNASYFYLEFNMTTNFKDKYGFSYDVSGSLNYNVYPNGTNPASFNLQIFNGTSLCATVKLSRNEASLIKFCGFILVGLVALLTA